MDGGPMTASQFRAELADAEVRLLIVAMTPYLISNSHRQPPLWIRHRAPIPSPRVTLEGVRHAARPR